MRQGDADAAQELWQRFEPVLKREIRLRLRDTRLRQRFDESDVCQSVMASFFVRTAMGQYELDTPEQMLRLLVRMARNKVAGQARRLRSRPADRLRVAGLDLREVVLQAPPPVMVTNELAWPAVVWITTELLTKPLMREKPVSGPAGPR